MATNLQKEVKNKMMKALLITILKQNYTFSFILFRGIVERNVSC